jgi:hypothetical protein
MSLIQRETFTLEANLQDEAGEAEDLTGHTIYVEASPPLLAADFDVDVDAADGRIVLTAPSSVTTAWPVGRFRVYLWILYSDPDPIEREVILPIDLTIEARI